jgi:multidrug efflux pump subunit AcrB
MRKMSFLTKWAMGNKAAVSLITVLVLTLGIVSYFIIPMEFLPNADNPQVTVIVMGQGTDSNTMESEVTSPIENVVSGVNGKSNVYSTTGDGFSKVDIFFDSNTDMKQAKVDVENAVNSLTLPQNVTKPSIVQLNTSMIPISQLAITFDDGLTRDNIKFAKQELVPLYKDIEGVSTVQAFGTEDSFVSIKVDNAKLNSLQVPIQNVMGVLQGQNTALAIGQKEIDGKTSNLKVIGEINSLDTLKNLNVNSNVKLADISTIEELKPENTLTRFNGEDALVLIISKDSHSNAVKVDKEINKVTKKTNNQYDKLHVNSIISSASLVKTSVDAMIKEVLLGALFATIVILIFLRNIRSTVITIVSIPLSLCFTLFLLSRSGVTLNILTLGGVAVAVGRLVDDSIVVIENIFRKMQNNSFSLKLVREAVKEVAMAITASTLTTVAVFLPIGLVSGSLQDFLLPFALTVTYSLLASLLVALTVVPLMSAGLLKHTSLPIHKPSKKFKNFVTWSLNHKWVVLSLAFLLFAGSIGVYFVLPKGATDQSSADFVATTLSYPNQTPIEKVKAETFKFEKYLLEQKEVKMVLTQLGNSADAAQFGQVGSPTQTTFNIILKDSNNTETFIKKVEKKKSDFKDADLTASTASFMMGAGSTNITIDVIGDNLGDIENTVNNIQDSIQGIDGVEKVTTNQDEKKTVYSLAVDPVKGNTQQIAQQLGGMLNPTPIGTINLESRKTSVFLEPLFNPKTPDELKNIPIITQTGILPVSEVATLKTEEKPTNLFHKEGDPYYRVTASVAPEKLSEISKEMNTKIFGDKEQKGLKLADGVEVIIGGANVQQMDDFTDLFSTMIISIGLVFLIMVMTFKTIKAPLAILSSLPLASIGAILGIIITGITVEVTALLGALMLIGIVVTNAIVLLDKVQQNEKTMIIRDAIVESATTRMRPILMTAVATICAMLPLLYKKVETGSLVSQSLAVVVIGGLSVATLLTLVVIPCVYELLYYKKSKKQRIKQGKQPIEYDTLSI